MKTFFGGITVLALALSIAVPANKAFGQSTSGVASPKTTAAATIPTAAATTTTRDGNVDVNRIIQAFAAKETEFRRALNNYVFKRDAVVQTIGQGGQISGEYLRVSQFVFDDSGNRFERILRFPIPNLQGVEMTAEDLEDLGGIQPFALEASKINQYNFTYVGKEKIDELNLHIFDVAPKVIPKKVEERFFQGRIWVDDVDLQIVKVRGKGVPEGKQRFPTFETYREQIDGKYWFPTYTYVDDHLEFGNGHVVHLKMRVRYADYKLAQGKLRIIETDDEPVDEAPSKNVPATPPAKPKP